VRVAKVRRNANGRPEVMLASSVNGARAAIAESLARLAKEGHANRAQCTTLLGRREYQFLPVEAPNVPPQELKTAISWRVKDMVDYPIEKATIDVLQIPAGPQAGASDEKPAFAVVAPTDLILQRQNLFTEGQIRLSVIDIPEMAQRNIASLLAEGGEGVALLSVDQDGSMLTISSGGELYLTRRIDVTSAQIEQAQEARRETFFDRIASETQRSLDAFERQFHYVKMTRLYLAPLASNGAGLGQYLSDRLDIPVEPLDLAEVFDFSRSPDLASPETQQQLFMTLGAALRQEDRAL